MPLVVDASVALAWAFPDESSGYADSVLAIVEQEGLLVPEPWIREVANGLAMAHRRKRITSADEQAFLFALSHLKIDVEASIGAIDLAHPLVAREHLDTQQRSDREDYLKRITARVTVTSGTRKRSSARWTRCSGQLVPRSRGLFRESAYK